MSYSKSDIFKELKSYIVISLGLLIYTFGFTSMLVNAGIVGGGAGGMSTLCYYGISKNVTVGVYYLIINSFLLLLGFIFIGPKFGAKTIYAILFSSLFLSIWQICLPKDILGMDFDKDKLILAIMGGICCGLGVGICFSQGGSSGGTDILAAIINKYAGIPIGRAVMLCDVVIIASSFFVFHEVRPIVYGFVVLAVDGYAIDSFLTGSKQSVKFIIISNKYKEIGDRIIHEAGRGVSYLRAEGGYTGCDRKIILLLCRRTEQSLIYNIVHDTDPDAFISVGLVTGVFGKGFEILRSK